METTYKALKHEIPSYLVGPIELDLSEKEITCLLECMEYMHEFVIGLTPAHKSVYQKVQDLYNDFVR